MRATKLTMWVAYIKLSEYIPASAERSKPISAGLVVTEELNIVFQTLMVGLKQFNICTQIHYSSNKLLHEEEADVL